MSTLKEQARDLPVVLRIGKKGMTESVIVEVEKLLKKRKLIKIKILNNCPVEKKEDVIKFVLDYTKSELVSVIGNTFAIYRLRKP